MRTVTSSKNSVRDRSGASPVTRRVLAGPPEANLDGSNRSDGGGEAATGRIRAAERWPQT